MACGHFNSRTPLSVIGNYASWEFHAILKFFLIMASTLCSVSTKWKTFFFSFESKSLLIFLSKYSFWSLKHRARLVNVVFTHNFWMYLWAFCHLCTLQIFRINCCAGCTSSWTVVQAHSRNLSFYFLFSAIVKVRSKGCHIKVFLL